MHITVTKTKNKKTGAIYENYKLVESVRTPKGPRNRIIMNLGNLNLSKDDRKKLAMVLEARIRGERSLFEEEKQIADQADHILAHFDFKRLQKVEQEQKELDEEKRKAVPVFLEKTSVTESRTMGAEMVAHHMWQELEMNDILNSCGLTEYLKALAQAVVIACLIEPGSELQCREWIRKRTALIEMLDEDISQVGKNSIYSIADHLLAHKDVIENKLREREGNLFGGKSTLFLYDLTNTYFEGSCKGNQLGKRGKSKEKRTDCPLVTLALLVDQRGFPIFSQIYEGNQSECETLKTVLDRLETDSQGILSDFKPTLVMDRGIATADNIQLLKSQDYHFVVVERRDSKKEYQEVFEHARQEFEIIKDLPEQSVYIKKIDVDKGARVLVFSESRKKKEDAMDRLKEERLIKDLSQLRQSIQKRNVVRVPKVSQRIGRVMERYPSVAKYYDINYVADEKGEEAIDITWERKPIREERSILTGCYVIETTHTELEAHEIWDIHHTLTQVEYAFRCLKTDLGMRPVPHQLADRTRGHLFISVLAYHLLIAIETRLRENDDTRKWSTIQKILSTHMRSTAILHGEGGQIHYIRVSGQAEPEYQEIYKKLGVKDYLKTRQVTLNKLKSST